MPAYPCCSHCDPDDTICQRLKRHMAYCEKPARGSHHEPCQTRHSWIRCASGHHRPPEQAMTVGLFVNPIHGHAVPDIWYCTGCAARLQRLGFFVPDQT